MLSASFRIVPIRRSPALLFVLALATACVPRAEVAPKPAPAEVGTTVNVLVGTTRAEIAPGQYHPSARGPLRFADIAVSIPPEHEAGKVEIGGADPDPAQHFLSRSIQPMGSGAFRAEVARRFASNPRNRKEAFIFIHGFNNTMGDGVFRTAQIASDLEMHALPIHYSWASSGRPLGYPTDRESALIARNGLQELIEEVAAAGASNIVLIAHSLGSQVTMEALRQMALSGRGPAWDRISGVALLAPDLDLDLFNAQARDIGQLPESFVILASDRDPALRLSARVTGQDARLGNISSIEEIAGLDVTVIDISAYRDTRNLHMAAVSSPTLIALISDTRMVQTAFDDHPSARVGFLPGTILTMQNATEIILDPTSPHIPDSLQ